jgi:hypothetical protein
VREDPSTWKDEDVAALRDGMKEAFDHLHHGMAD